MQQEYWNNYLAQIEERSDLSGLVKNQAKIKLSEYKHIKETLLTQVKDKLLPLGMFHAVLKNKTKKTSPRFDGPKGTKPRFLSSQS